MLCPVCGTKFVESSSKQVDEKGIVFESLVREDGKIFLRIFHTCLAGHKWETKQFEEYDESGFDEDGNDPEDPYIGD